MPIANAIHDMLSPALSAVQSGGAKGAKGGGNGLLLFVIILALFLVRAYIVQFAFNKTVPMLITRLSADPQKTLMNYRPISYTEAIFLTLLTSSLFN